MNDFLFKPNPVNLSNIADAQTSNNYLADPFAGKTSKEIVDTLEREMGIKAPIKKENIKKHVATLAPDDDADKELLELILNNPDRYNINYMDKTWTVRGEYRMFIVYSENLNVKPNESK